MEDLIKKNLYFAVTIKVPIYSQIPTHHLHHVANITVL
jgi:hypothetical protein